MGVSSKNPFLLATLPCFPHDLSYMSSIWVIFVGCPIFYLAVAIQFRPHKQGASTVAEKHRGEYFTHKVLLSASCLSA